MGARHRPLGRRSIILLLGLVGVYGLSLQIRFGHRAVSAAATVETVGARQGLLRFNTNVVHGVEGRPVTARVRTWFYPLEQGRPVKILYVPGDPGRAELASAWQRYLGPCCVLLVFCCLALLEATAFR